MATPAKPFSYRTKKSKKSSTQDSTKSKTTPAPPKHQAQENCSTSPSTPTGDYSFTSDNESRASNFNTPASSISDPYDTTRDETADRSFSSPYSQMNREIGLLGIGAWISQEEQDKEDVGGDHTGDGLLVEKFGEINLEELNYDYVRRV